MFLSGTSPVRFYDSGTWRFPWMARQHQDPSGTCTLFFLEPWCHYFLFSSFFPDPLCFSFSYLAFLFLCFCYYKDLRFLNFYEKKSHMGTLRKHHIALSFSQVIQSHTDLSFFFRWMGSIYSVDGYRCWSTYSGLGILHTISLFVVTTSPWNNSEALLFPFTDENTEAYRCKSPFHVRTILWFLTEVERNRSRQTECYVQTKYFRTGHIIIVNFPSVI